MPHGTTEMMRIETDAPRWAPVIAIGLATAVIFGGVAAASVLGVPIGVLIADIADWRTAFSAMAAFSGLVLWLNLQSLPSLPVKQTVRPEQFLNLLARRPVWLGLSITLLLVAGHFMAYTFVRPLLQDLSGASARWIGPLLFAYGAAGVAGNFIAGAMAARREGAACASFETEHWSRPAVSQTAESPAAYAIGAL